jgi:hypothetical protein
MGYMPDIFKDFQNIMGIPKAKSTQTENNMCNIMRKHTYQMFKTYWRQRQLLNEKGEVILLSTENSHSTQQTELEAIEEEMSENDTPSENDSNTDEEAEEEYWQKAGPHMTTHPTSYRNTAPATNNYQGNPSYTKKQK